MLGSKSEKFNSTEAQQNVRYSYKKSLTMVIFQDLSVAYFCSQHVTACVPFIQFISFFFEKPGLRPCSLLLLRGSSQKTFALMTSLYDHFPNSSIGLSQFVHFTS